MDMKLDKELRDLQLLINKLNITTPDAIEARRLAYRDIRLIAGKMERKYKV